ncbi:redox-regulated ATPase YchF [Haliangium sp.]|uniref:redox-regulated ATPase YchF n=1 Tax=Haliangium sp. TaxID=2663208 RepID=UPI003D11886D
MKIGLVGLPGAGKSTVFGALTGMAVETGYGAGAGKQNLGTVKVPDARVDALAALYQPKKTTYAEVAFTDLGGGGHTGIDRAQLNAMREVDALCQVVRGFPDAAGDPPDPVNEIVELETETILADLEIVERRVERLRKDRSNPRELEVLEQILARLEGEQPVRGMELDEGQNKLLSGYRFLSAKPLLLVLNVSEDQAAAPAPGSVVEAAEARGLGLVVLSAQIEMDIAQMSPDEQPEFLATLGLEEPAKNRFIQAAYQLIDLISMLTAGPDECRAWPVPRGAKAPRAAGKIHSDIERGFIRAEVVPWQDLIELGSEAKCREAGKLRVEGKEYVVQDGDVVHFRFNV